MSRMPSTLLVQLLLSGALAGGAQEPSETAPTWSFSEGPLARALAERPAEPAPRPSALPVSALTALGEDADWSGWAQRLQSLRAAEQPSERAAERLWLAVFARMQGRDDDAWEHLAHAAADGAALEAVLPLFVPGAVATLADGTPKRLEDGAVFAPALPPPRTAAAEVVLGTGRPRPGFARVEGLAVGEARIDVNVRVETDGVQVDLTHVSGPALRLFVLLPQAPDFELRSEYVDWIRQEGPPAPREVELVPGAEPLAVFGRFRHRKVAWPTEVPGALPAALSRAGLRLVAEDQSSRRLAEALPTLLGVDVRLEAPSEREEVFAGITIDLSDADTRAGKRAGIVSLAERFALAERP